VIVVLDTNVWISALQFAKRGTPTRALEKTMSEDVIASCREIEAEILRVLTHKFAWESTSVPRWIRCWRVRFAYSFAGQ
jgi:predicted nucleic acid-binding protein